MNAPQRDLIGPDTRTKLILLTRSSTTIQQPTITMNETQKTNNRRTSIDCSANPCNPHSHPHSNAQLQSHTAHCPIRLSSSQLPAATPHRLFKHKTTRRHFLRASSYIQLYATAPVVSVFLLMTSGLVHFFGDTRLVQKRICPA